ncbi:hypothetical protein H1_55 [Efunavirus H1]|uniref:Uncharacterized protein n=1 Tax=Enterococcus phage H1 TaxID=2982918 RepID=A0A9Y1DJQ1_9CAUD|nr:hypothetical protein H1_55 [Enterococcus phage H1]
MTTVSRGEITITNVNDGKTPYFHTAYTNSTDFGAYDYSGNPNLMKNITNDSWTAEGVMKITAAGDYLELVKDTAGRYGTAKIYNIPALRTNSQYTTSLEFYLKSGTSVEDLKKCNIAIEATNTSGQVYYSVIYLNSISKMDEWVDLTSTFTTNTYTDNLINWAFRVYVHPDVSASMRIRNNIKIEEGPNVTPYQPNIKDAPWYFSTTPLGENIANKDVKFPINVDTYKVYEGDMLESFQVGETYTVTIKGRKPPQKTFSVYNAGTVFLGNLTPVEGLSDVWTGTFKVPSINSGYPNRLQIYQLPNDNQYGDVQIDWVKIEKSPVSTPNIDAYKYLGNYADYEQVDSLNPTKYDWNLIKGATPHFHTAYTNSTDFGTYDYSGNPNIIVTDADTFKLGTGGELTYNNGEYTILMDGTARLSRYNTDGKNSVYLADKTTYTLSCEMYVGSDYTGNVDQIFANYAYLDGGYTVLQTSRLSANAPRDTWITVRGTSTTNYQGRVPKVLYFSWQTVASETNPTGTLKIRNIKIERGDTNTPYQPNLLNAPYYLGKTALNENLIESKSYSNSNYLIGSFPIKKSVKDGEKVTFTLKGTKPNTKQFGFYIQTANGANTEFQGHLVAVEGLPNTWSWTGNLKIMQTTTDTAKVVVYQLPPAEQVPNDSATIEWAKLEKGDTRTPNIDSYKYLGSYVDFDQADSPNPTKYSWNLIKGSDGEPAKTLILSTSSNTVKINQDSSIQSDTITLQANMQNMVGTATFSAIPYIGTTPQTAITLGGAGNTRTFSTSSWNKNWTSLVVTATFESFIDKQTIISVKEGKDGTDSITGLLTNESVTLAADKNGTVESFSEASGTFKVFDGLSDVTGKNVAYTLKSSLGGTFNINASTGAYNMTAMSKDSATATFEATYKNIKIEKILNVAKSKAGKETYTYTKYSNSKDFGNYDYSGKPNLMHVIKASDFNNQSDVSVSDVGFNSIRLTSQGIDRMSAYTTNNIPSLVSGKTYTISAKIKIEEGTTGNIDKIRVSYRKTNNGTILLYARSDGAEAGKEIIIKRTETVNYEITDLSRFYLTIDLDAGAKINGSIIVSDIKIEEGSIATPFQPNLLDEPYWLGKAPLGENIANTAVQFPINSSKYTLYSAKMQEPFVVGNTYTITLEGTKPATQAFNVYGQAVEDYNYGSMEPVEGLVNTWSLTFTPSKVSQDHPTLLQIIQKPGATIGACTVNWLKIEKGDTRTPNIDSYKYMGIYVGGESEQPHNPTQYAWSQIKGNDSTSYSLLLSSQVMSLPRGASKLVPENITISGMAQTGEKSIENINSRIVVEETTNGTTWTTKYDADALTYTYTPSSLNVLSARVKMYVAGAKNVQLDQKSINIVKDGSNGSNGSSSYTWVRYSENANGNPMTTTSNSKTKYIGIAITQTSTAPSAYGDYTWSRIKGSGGLVAKVYSNGGTNIEQSPIQINVETQSDGDIVEPNKVTWYMSKDSSVEWTAITAGNGITLNKKYIVVEPVVFLESNSISFKAQVEYNSMTAFDYMTVNNKSFDATKPLILRQPAAPLNPYPGLLWLDTSSGSGDPLDKTNPSLVYRWGKSAVESVIGTEYAHYAYANTPTGYQEDGVTPDSSFSVTYNSSQKPMYIGYCVTDTASDPTTPSSYNWKSITTENGSEDVNGAKGIAQEKIETTYVWGWVVLSASDLEMLPWLNNEDGSTIIDWIYQITQKTSDDSIVQTVVGSEDMSKVYAKTDAVDELSSANHELSDKIEEYNKQMQDAFAGIDTTYVNKSEFEQEMNKFNFGIDKAGGVNLIRNSTGFQWEDTAPSDEMLTNPKFEGTISTTGLDNGWVYNDTGMGQIIGAENDLPEYKIMRIGGTNSRTKYSYSKNIPVTPGQLINISGQARIPNTIGDTQHIYVSIRFYGAASDPLANSEADTIGDGQGFIYLFTDKKHNAGSIFGTDSYTVKTNNIVQDIWSNYSVNVTIPSGAAFMKICLYNSSTTVTDYFDFRKPSVVLYSGMFDFWHKNDSANAQIRQILGDESLEELGLIAGFELKGLRYKLDQDILLPNPNTEYTLSWYANKISQSGTSKYYVKVLNTKTGAEIAVSEASADTIGYQRMSVTFSVTNTSAVTIRIGLEGEGSADATLSAAGLMINIGPYPLSWQSHHEEVYSTNVRIDSSGLKVFNSDYDGYNVMTPREFAGYYRNGEVYERVFTLNKDTTKVKKLEAQERFMMRPVQIVSVDSPTIQGWAFVGYNGEDTD